MKKTRLHHIIAKDSELRGGYTQGDIQNNIGQYGVLVDGTVTHDRLKWIIPGQDIRLNNWPVREVVDLSGVKIVAEYPRYYVLFKPSGIIVHPGAGTPDGTLLNWILDTLPGQEELQEEAEETDNAHISAGLVHRLDKDTAGLIIVAKTLSDHKHLQDLWRDRSVTKEYLAVLDGILDTEKEVKGWQSRDLKKPRYQKYFSNESDAIFYDPEARYAHSVFTPITIDPKQNQTLVKVVITTGRMHQIRLHAAQALGVPVLNDTLYNKNPVRDSTFRQLTPYLLRAQLQLLSNAITIEGEETRLI